ncbi:hypothetical protein E4T44_00893 [Aureobasidium sp. EXF-8845]|nr:hypothetical protein E4T44_00893 [Aureobasidium sp. EXF-8845]KAI4857658.1 hypothetical protein E4T45_00844 [Aureobasidium sp. EXF-8846]
MPRYLLAATQNRHWAVVASTIGVLLLKLTTIVSTGLIVLEPTIVMTTDNPFVLTSDFSIHRSALDNVTGSPGNLFYGVQTHGLPSPKGVSSDLVVQTFRPRVPLPSNAIYSAEVQGVEINFDCEIVDIDNSTVAETDLDWISVLASSFIADIHAGNCTVRNVVIAKEADHRVHHDPYATQNFQGTISNVTCSDGVDNSLPGSQRPDHSNYTDQRILITMADLRWVIDAAEVGESEQAGDRWWVQDAKAVLCHPSYNLNTYRVGYPVDGNYTQGSVKTELIANGTDTLPGLSNAQLTKSVFTVLNNMFLGSGGADYVLATEVGSFFQLLSATNNNSR